MASDPPHASTLQCAHCGLPIARHTNSCQGEQFCCYGCFLVHSLSAGTGSTGQPVALLARLGVASFFAMNVMVLSWSMYGDRLSFLFPQDVEASGMLNLAALAMSLPVMFLLGAPYLRNAWNECRRLRPGVDTLIAVGTGAAFVQSLIVTLSRPGEATYFDTACMVLVLVTAGRYIEAEVRRRGLRYAEEAVAGIPVTARKVCDGREQEVAAATIAPGDILRVLPGELVPADGTILEGKSMVADALLTGEANAHLKQPGDAILGGAVNHDGVLVLRAERPAAEIFLAQLDRLAKSALSSRSEGLEAAENIARWFVPGVLVLSVAAGMAQGMQSGGLWQSLFRSLSVLLIACPCALSIGPAVAAAVGYGTAARRGMLFRSLGAFERLASVQEAFFDKTGTLTEGKTSVTAMEVLPEAALGKEALIAAALSLCTTSRHPVARAVASFGRLYGGHIFPVKDVREVPGAGVSGVVDIPDVGPVPMSVERCTDLHLVESLWNGHEGTTGTSIQSAGCIVLQKKVQAIFLVTDAVRAEAVQVVEELHGEGLRTTILSGDRKEKVDALRSFLGAGNAYGEMLPAEKQLFVKAAVEKGKSVCMVGDGMNDAPALAAATVGIAVGDSVDLVRAAADVLLVDAGIERIPWLVRHARNVTRTIRWNLFWAFGYNSVGIALAAAGLLHPVVSAAAMLLSSITVLGLSLWLAREEEGAPAHLYVSENPRGAV